MLCLGWHGKGIHLHRSYLSRIPYVLGILVSVSLSKGQLLAPEQVGG